MNNLPFMIKLHFRYLRVSFNYFVGSEYFIILFPLFSHYQSTTRVKPFICTMPMRLDEGWNQIQFNLSDFTRRAYGTNYIETLR